MIENINYFFCTSDSFKAYFTPLSNLIMWMWRHICSSRDILLTSKFLQIFGDTATIAKHTSTINSEKIGRKSMTKLINLCQEIHDQLYEISQGKTNACLLKLTITVILGYIEKIKVWFWSQMILFLTYLRG